MQSLVEHEKSFTTLRPDFDACEQQGADQHAHLHSLVSTFEPRHEISNNMYVRPTKPQISLRICAVLSESLLVP